MVDFAQANMLVNLSIFTVAAAIVWLAGARITGHANAISSKTGIRQATIGLLLLGGVTSLPEFSTSVTAARDGLHTLAVSDVLGTNLINIGLILVIDLAGTEEPILNQGGAFGAFGTLLGIALTTLFVIGMAERGDKTVLRMGLDSAAVLICYFVGLIACSSCADREP